VPHPAQLDRLVEQREDPRGQLPFTAELIVAPVRHDETADNPIAAGDAKERGPGD